MYTEQHNVLFATRTSPKPMSHFPFSPDLSHPIVASAAAALTREKEKGGKRIFTHNFREIFLGRSGENASLHHLLWSLYMLHTGAVKGKSDHPFVMSLTRQKSTRFFGLFSRVCRHRPRVGTYLEANEA